MIKFEPTEDEKNEAFYIRHINIESDKMDTFLKILLGFCLGMTVCGLSLTILIYFLK